MGAELGPVLETIEALRADLGQGVRGLNESGAAEGGALHRRPPAGRFWLWRQRDRHDLTRGRPIGCDEKSPLQLSAL